ELPVVAYVIVVRVRIKNHDGAGGQTRHEIVQVADAHAGVEEQRLFGAHDQIGDGLFGLVRFVDGEDARLDLVDLEPGLVNEDALEGSIFRAREGFAPVGGNGRLGLR